MSTYQDLQGLPEKGLVYNLQAQVVGVGPIKTEEGQYGRSHYCWLKLVDTMGVELFADLYLNDQDVAGLGQPPNLEPVLKGQAVVISAYASARGQTGAQKVSSTRDGSARLRLRGLRALGVSANAAPQQQPVQARSFRPQQAQAARTGPAQGGGSTARPLVVPPKPTWPEQEAMLVDATLRIADSLRSASEVGRPNPLDRPSYDACLETAERIAVHLSMSLLKGEVQRPVAPPPPQPMQAVTGGMVPTPFGPVPGPVEDPAWFTGDDEPPPPWEG